MFRKFTSSLPALTAAFALATNIIVPTAQAAMASFAWPSEVVDVRVAYQEAQKEEEKASVALQSALKDYADASQAYANKLAEIGVRESAWQGNRALARKQQILLRKWQREEEKLQSKARVERDQISRLEAENQKLEAKPFGLSQLEQERQREILADVTRAQTTLSNLEREIAALAAKREDRLKKDAARQEKLRPSTEIYAEIFAALDAQIAARTAYQKAGERYEKAGAEAKRAVLDYYSWFENTRPPFIKRVQVKHGRKLLYDAEWIPTETGENNSKVEEEIIRSVMVREKEIRALSQRRIELLERNRTLYREHMNEARADAQYLQQQISSAEIFELRAKLFIELAVISAEIALTGGALTAASEAASLSVQTAVKAYSKKAAEEFAKNSGIRKQIAEIASKLNAEATVKQLEDRIAESYSNRGYYGLSKTIGSEVTEWAFSEVIGEGFSSINKGVAKEASQKALQSVVPKKLGGIGLKEVLKNADARAVKASLALAATEIIAKVSLAYGTETRVAELANEKLAKQIEVFVTQWQWNKIHTALLQERLRFARIDARVAALEKRMEYGRLGYELKVTADEVLTIEAIKGKHNVDIAFETSERLSNTPSIESFGGFEVNDMERAPKLGENWWKAFAVLDEDLLASRFTIPLKIEKADRFNPYSELDSNPGTNPSLTSLSDPSWDGFEPGADENHAVRLSEQSQDYVCALPEDDAQPNSEAGAITAGIVSKEQPSNCTYWGVPGLGILAMHTSGDNVQIDWVKILGTGANPNGRQDANGSYNSDFRYWDFEEGSFIKARRTTPTKNAEEGSLWGQQNYLLAGQITTPAKHFCDIWEQPELFANAQLSSPAFIRVEKEHLAPAVPQRALMEIVLDPSETFKREVVYKVQRSDGGEPYEHIGIPQCVRHIYPTQPSEHASDILRLNSSTTEGRRHIYAARLNPDVDISGITIENLNQFISDETLPASPFVAATDSKTIDAMVNARMDSEVLNLKRKITFLQQLDTHVPYKGAEYDVGKSMQEDISYLREEITLQEQGLKQLQKLYSNR